MRVEKININNFRLLKNFSVDLEDSLSLIIGKNNTGKTSILTALNKFLNGSDKNKFTFDDFNVDVKTEIVSILTAEAISEVDYIPIGITLKVFITYRDSDDLSQISSLIMSLEEDDNNIVLRFAYELSFSKLVEMRNDYFAQVEKYNNDPLLFLREKHGTYFGEIKRKSESFRDEKIFTDLNREGISLVDVISFRYVSAKRSVTNKENDKTLSVQTSRIYKKTSESSEHVVEVDKFKQKLRETDVALSDIYKSMFDDVIKKIGKFGGLRPSDTEVKIASTLQHRELLDGNTTVLYTQNAHDLPEHYNGLGYMNLISMIFDIEILMKEFKRSLAKLPAAINLLFIEEPEAHTHPQMQYIFIKNIKQLLAESRKREDNLIIQLQTVISTHSCHIVSECDFDDIKYLKKHSIENSVESKNLKALKNEYSSLDPVEDEIQKKCFKFLKQYLTLNRAELFFADKAILIEGETERILLPAMMRKIDNESANNSVVPLLSQNISIVEVGAHSQTFEKFIDFVGVKTLIITDIDSCSRKVVFEDDGITPKLHANGNAKEEVIKCVPDDPSATHTTNNSLTFFYGKKSEDLSYFIGLTDINQKALAKRDAWLPDVNGRMLLAFQTAQNGYHARSFEDSFFSINKEFLGQDSERFPSLVKKWFDKYIKNECTPFEFAEKAVGSKPSLAIEVLINSESIGGNDFANWRVPNYIKDGLEWLRIN